jgi:hypothetical protein
MSREMSTGLCRQTHCVVFAVAQRKDLIMEIAEPFAGAVASFSLADLQRAVADMPDIEGNWANPASLTRFNRTSMPEKMFNRLIKKIEPYDMGHKPSDESVWRDFDEPCWLWTGGLHPKGYGRFYMGFEPYTDIKIWAYAHRLSFEHWVCIPKPGYIVDHECEVKTCCNPVHLWPLSGPDNTRIADQRRPWKRRNQYSKE